jgi:diguanylate cyclase (GGDEF)-like protein/PAS domain S-box-containing protein
MKSWMSRKMQGKSMKTSSAKNPEKKCVSEAASHDYENFRLAFDAAADGILLVDAESGDITNVNRAFVKLSGYPVEEVAGRKLWEIAAIGSTDTKFILQQAKEGRKRVYLPDQQIETREGKQVDVEVLCSVYVSDKDTVIQCNIRDVTERKTIELARPRSEDQFRRIFEGNPQPMWIFAKNSLDFLALNDAAIELFGYSREEFMTMTMLNILVPSEIPDFLDSIGNVNSPLLKPDVWQLKRNNGETIEVEIASNELTFNGRMSCFVVATDVTAQKQAEQMLRESRRLLQEMLDALPIGVMLTESTGDIIIKNPAMKQIWGGEESFGRDRYDEYKGRWSDTGKEIASREWAVTRALIEGKTTLDEMIDIETADGTRKTVLNSAVPLKDSGGKIAGAIIVNQDITERRRQEEELKRVHALVARQATTDTLTGIFNRLKFNELLDIEIRGAMRYRHPLSMIMFDIDHFKSINDTYGHLIGDAVLKEIAGLVAGNIRNVDVFARWGGEEFVILSPDSSLKAVSQVAEKLRKLIEVSSFSSPCKVTVSFGLAEFKEDDVANSFLNRADAALYRAKSFGRNRVEPC